MSSTSSSLEIVEEEEDGEEEEEEEEDEELDDDVLVEDVVDKVAGRFLGIGKTKPRAPAVSIPPAPPKPLLFDDCPEFKRPEPSESDMSLLQIASIPGYPHKTAAVAEIDSRVSEYWILIWMASTAITSQGGSPPAFDLSNEEDISGESGGKIWQDAEQ